MNRLLPESLLALCCCVAIASIPASAQARDAKPPQVSVAFLNAPSPFIQEGKPHLVYEMLVTNYIGAAYVLESVDVEAGARRFIFAGGLLSGFARILGAPIAALDTAKPERGGEASNLKIDPGRTVILYLRLDFQTAREVPPSLKHALHILAPDGSRHVMDIPPLTVDTRAPVVIGVPLKGSHWLAAGTSNGGSDAYHRRTIILGEGQPWLAQRYAIDWVQYQMINGMGQTWRGAEDQNSSYFCYGKPIYSATPGKVVEAADGIPENIPHSGKYAVDLTYDNAAGNHAVVDIGGGHYVMYAHMIPGSVTVRVNDAVVSGQILGRVGNSGSSTEPHLHLQVVDHPSFIFANGVPYVFRSFAASPPGKLVWGAHDRVTAAKPGPLREAHDDYPASDAAVTFR